MSNIQNGIILHIIKSRGAITELRYLHGNFYTYLTAAKPLFGRKPFEHYG
jgi:hypothetical protein